MRRIPCGRVIWIRASGEAAASDPRVAAAPFDFVCIDADHSNEELRADWNAWAPLAGDIPALHDVGSPEQGSVRFALEHVFTDARFRLVEQVGCLAVLERRERL